MINTRYLAYLVTGVRPPRRSPRRRSGRGPARSWKYRAWIRSQACCVCGSSFAVAAAHTVNAGLRIKGSDYSCVPLCFEHHRAYDSGLRSKGLFEIDHNISMAAIVRSLNHEWFSHAREVK